MGENFESKYEIDASSAIEALKELDRLLGNIASTGRLTRNKMAEIAAAIDEAAQNISGTAESVEEFKRALKGIAESTNTVKQATDAVGEASRKMQRNIKDGTNAVVTAQNQEVKAVAVATKKKEDILRQRDAREQQARRQRIANQQKENRLADLAGEPKPHPNVGLTEEEIAAKEKGILKRREDEIAASEERKLKVASTVRAKNAKEYQDSLKREEERLLESERKQEEIINNARRHETSFDSFSNVGDDAEKQYREVEKRVNDRIALEKKGDDIIAETKKKQREADATVAEFFRQKEEAREKKITEAFEQEVEKRVKDYKRFKDLQRKGIDPTKAKNLTTDELNSLSRGADLAKGKSTSAADAAALSRIKELAAEQRRAAEFQDQLVKGAQQLGIPLEGNVQKMKEFTLSWESIGRIIVARAITQAFFSIQNSIQQSVKSATELFNIVAEIQTITSRDSQGTVAYATAFERIIQLSSKLNFTPDDVGVAVYEALSNQLGDTTDQLLSFIEVAGNLGKVTRASLGDAADAI